MKLKIPKINWHKKYIVFSVIFLIIAAIALTWFLQYRYFINNIDLTWGFVWGRPAVFWYNALLMLLILLFLTGLTRRPAIAAGITWSFFIILTYIHINKFNSRGAPLLPEDFTLAGEAEILTKFIDVGALVRMIIAVILVLFLSVLLNWYINKKFELPELRRGKQKWWEKSGLVSRIVIVVISSILFLNLTEFVRHHNGQRYEDIPWLNSQLVAWNQVRNYDYNGFILGFLYNLQKLKLTPPDGYDEAKMLEISAKYQKLAKSNNKERVDLSDEDVSIVIVLNESFIDPSVEFNGYRFEDYYQHTGGEILPSLRAIQAKYPSGLMYSTDYGGGTANIEFEVLTGLTNYWINTVPYTDLIPKTDDIPSIASFFKNKGYLTTAIHPFNGTMYKRNIALRSFGFDEYITELEMSYTEKEGKSEYINDRSAYRQTLDVLNSSEKNQLVALITMQNHLPYNADTYEETQFTVTNTNLEEGRISEIEVYYQMLHNSDKYLGEFISELDSMDKKVVVLFFGDHSAGIFNLTNDNEEKGARDLSRLTPYFVYSNYGAVEKTALPTTTPNCLSNTLLNLLNSKKPNSLYLSDRVCAETPILANAWFDNEAPFRTTALSEYELVTYDLLGGKQHWKK